MTQLIRIATRQSRLALWQAQWVARRLSRARPDVLVELVPMKTEGDRRLDDSLAKIGGKGLFIKELENALLERRAEIAVHSMKDVPVQMPAGFHIAAVLPRADPRDALITDEGGTLATLPHGAIVGTSSLRRQSQLRHARPDLQVTPLRGNVDTRLRKVSTAQYDAIVLAAAGLTRLGLSGRISEYLDTSVSLPAAAQGAVGIECLSDATQLTDLLGVLDDDDCRHALAAERAFCLALGADCTSPVAALATVDNDQLTLHARVAAADGSTVLDETVTAPLDAGDNAGVQAAQRLLARGAAALLETGRHV